MSDSGGLVCSWSLLFAAIIAAFRQKLHLSPCADLRDRLYVHEFIDETALRIGKDKELDAFDKNINRAYHFISFIQNQKVATFNREYNEDHHHRGKIAKKINATNKRIKRRIAEMYAFLQSLPADSKYSMQIEALIIRPSMERLFSIYEEYVSAVAEFAYISYGRRAASEVTSHTVSRMNN